MKNVLFFIDTLGYGGAEKVLVNLVNGLDKSKYNITVLTIFDAGVNKKYLDENIKYKYIFKNVFRGNVTYFKLFSPEYLYKKYIRDKFDIVISYLEGNTTRILSGCPYVDTKKIAWIHVEMSKTDRIYPYRSLKECYNCYKKYDKIIGVSKSVIDSFSSHLSGFENLCVKYNTIDTDYIKNSSLIPVEDIHLNDNYINLVSVGRLIPQKSYMRLLHVINKIKIDFPNVRLYIIGVGSQQKLLQSYINNNRLNDIVFLLGFKDNPWKYVSKCDLFICSSIAEGFSTAVSEALILGVPVVTTLCSGMYELLGNNEYGMIVNNNETALYKGLKDILSDKSLLLYYRKQAQIRGAYFDKNATINSIEDMLDNLI